MNRSDPNADVHRDELLNSFIDEELTDKQQAELEKLIAHDRQIARRLQQLQKTKMLISSLPRAKAPADMSEQVKASLEARKILAQSRSTSGFFSERKGSRHLLVRRVLAAAAMIALVAILSGVVYTIIAPETVPDKTAEIFVAAETTPFSGRLELKTHALVEVDGFINRFIDETGLSDFVSVERQAGQSLYSLSCSRQSLNSLLADLAGIWQRFDSSKLFVETEQFGEQVVIHAITAEQTAELVNQDSPDRIIEVARDFAILNNMADLMPGKQIFAAIDDRKVGSITPPKPFLTEYPKKAQKAASQPKEATLTLVVISSE